MGEPADVVSFRMPGLLQNAMMRTIADRNKRTRNPEWTKTDFILEAIIEKIAKMERSRRPRPRKGMKEGKEECNADSGDQ